MHLLLLITFLTGLNVDRGPADTLYTQSTRSLTVLADQVDRMPIDEQLEEYFGARPATDRRGVVRGGSGAYSLTRLQRDPAIRRHFEAIEASWLLRSNGSVPATEHPGNPLARDLVETKVIVARNLFLRGVGEISAGTVTAEMDRLRSNRRRLAATPLFRGRTVVYAASADRLSDGRPTFGGLADRVAVERDAERFYFFRGDERQSPAGEAASLENLLRSRARLTFVFEGHGRDKALKLDRSLRVGRLASLLASRPAHLPSPILILDACRAHDFARNLLAELARRGTDAAPPVIIVPDEYGQNLIKDVFGGRFLRRDLEAGDPASTIGTALQSQSRRLSVYAPDDHDVPMQIG
ncbi:MAG: hypothetical protein MPN21_14225 [Thermoanaerobaculia bacterium]|nr:hypothetical protein [Thermoanaerobaculia bacterium]